MEKSKDTCQLFDSFVKYMTIYLVDTLTDIFKELAEKLPQLTVDKE